MSVQDNKATYQSLIDAFNTGDLDSIGGAVTENHVFHAPRQPSIEGFAGYRAYMSQYRTAFPDVHMATHEMVGEGDMVAVRWTGTGTHTGELAGIPASGKGVNVAGSLIVRFENGKVAEQWQTFDELGMMQQMGVIPAS